MSTEKFFIADPFNDEHLALYTKYDADHGINTKSTAYMLELRKQTTKAEYETLSKKNNEFTQSLFLQDGSKIKDSCYIKGEKDIKTCNITFVPVTFKTKNRRLLSLATDYAFNVLGMEEVFVSISPNDNHLEENLALNGFENIGELNGYKTYLKEKELERQEILVPNL